MVSLTEVFRLAVRHVAGGTMESSARLCLADARRAEERGDLTAARMWAVKSLGYSVGVFHPDHQRAAMAR